jgi:hypothetical protein
MPITWSDRKAGIKMPQSRSYRGRKCDFRASYRVFFRHRRQTSGIGRKIKKNHQRGFVSSGLTKVNLTNQRGVARLLRVRRKFTGSAPEMPCEAGNARAWDAEFSRGFQTTLRMARMMTSHITRNTKNRIFAIPMAAPAIPVNPRSPAMIAMMRKISDQCNIPVVEQFMRQSASGAPGAQ